MSSASVAKVGIEDFLVQKVGTFLERHVEFPTDITVGLSGGKDSVALLHTLMELRRLYPFQLSAVHINHQIHSDANQWEAFCSNLCLQWNIPFYAEQVYVERKSLLGLEGAAREARYGIFNKIKTPYLALAHHQKDQIETVLFRLLRGGGIKGVTGMHPLRLLNASTQLIRPMLGVSQADITEYAKKNKLKWVEDPSNTDESYTRNFLRHKIWPLLQEKFPHLEKRLERSISHFQEADLLLDELAQLDLQPQTPKAFIENPAIAVSKFQLISFLRAKNLLRYLLQILGTRSPNARRLEEVVRQMQSITMDNHFSSEVGKYCYSTSQAIFYLSRHIS